jgi:AcrR family transcriptional regulator
MSREYKKRKRAESEEATRQRITEATMHLHETVGPARTTVSGIADEAGVQRATVYRHFPDETALIDACSNHWLSIHPPPDPTPWMAIADPDERLRTALREMYAYYETTGETLEKLVHDAPRVPAIAQRMRVRTGALDQLADLLMTGRGLRGSRRNRVRAAIGHGLQLETWHSLVREQGLSADDAAELIAKLAA